MELHFIVTTETSPLRNGGTEIVSRVAIIDDNGKTITSTTIKTSYADAGASPEDIEKARARQEEHANHRAASALIGTLG